METRTKGLNKTGIAVIIAVIVVALLAALVIPTMVNVSKQAKLNAEYQAKNDQQIASIVEKLENTNSLTMEEIQKTIASEIEKYHKDDAAALTEAKVKEIVNSALKSADILTEDEVKKIVEDALKDVGGLTEAQVKSIVNNALKNAGLTEAKVKDIVNEALKGVGGLTEAQVKAIVNEALKGIDTGLSKAEVEKLIADALANQEPADTRTVEEKLAAGESVTLSEDHVLNTEVAVPAGAKVTLDLNGKKLTVTETGRLLVQGEVTLTNGSVDTFASLNEEGEDMGLVVAKGGKLTVTKTSMKVQGGGEWCVFTGSGGHLTIEDSSFAVGAVDAGATPNLLFNNGTTVVKNSIFTNAVPGEIAWDAAIANYADLTLIDTKVDAAGICVATMGDNSVSSTCKIVGGEYRTNFQQKYHNSAIYMSFGVLTLENNVKIYVPNADHAAIEVDEVMNGSMNGDDYTVILP